MNKNDVRIATQPRVYVIARPQLDWSAIADFFQDELDNGVIEYDPQANDPRSVWYRTPARAAEYLVEFAGRLCYMSFGKAQGRKDSSKYIKNLLEMQHGSVLEHAVWSLLIADVSRGLSHELVRHRPFAVSQQSSRYVMPKAEIVRPPQLDNKLTLQESWLNSAYDAIRQQELLGLLYEADDAIHVGDEPMTASEKRESRKRAREVGRSLMPHAAVTRLVLTGNAREWRWFLQVRGGDGAEPEIKRLARAILPVLKQEAPTIFGDLHEDDQGLIASEHWKV